MVFVASCSGTDGRCEEACEKRAACGTPCEEWYLEECSDDISTDSSHPWAREEVECIARTSCERLHRDCLGCRGSQDCFDGEGCFDLRYDENPPFCAPPCVTSSDCSYGSCDAGLCTGWERVDEAE